MNKRTYNGIQMEVTRYNPSKELMRKGLMQAIEAGRISDNQTRAMLVAMEHMSIDIKKSQTRRCAMFFT